MKYALFGAIALGLAIIGMWYASPDFSDVFSAYEQIQPGMTKAEVGAILNPLGPDKGQVFVSQFSGASQYEMWPFRRGLKVVRVHVGYGLQSKPQQEWRVFEKSIE